MVHALKLSHRRHSATVVHRPRVKTTQEVEAYMATSGLYNYRHARQGRLHTDLPQTSCYRTTMLLLQLIGSPTKFNCAQVLQQHGSKSLSFHLSLFFQHTHALSTDSKTEPKWTFSYDKQTCDFNHVHSLMSMQQSAFLAEHLFRTQTALPCHKRTAYKVRVLFSISSFMQPVRIGPPSANQFLFTAKPSGYHVHSTLWVTPPTSPCPTSLLFCAVPSMT